MFQFNEVSCCNSAILIEIVYLYAWASGAIAKFTGISCKLKFY